MTQVFVVACNGCGAESRPQSYVHKEPGWHIYEARDLCGGVQRIDLCPDCFGSVPFSKLTPEAVEAAVEATSER